jgi:hypothetical protein
MTADLIASAPLDPVIFDDGVGEQLATHIVERRVCDGVIMLNLDQLTRANIGNAGEPKAIKRIVNSAPLGIKHTRFERDIDMRFHWLHFRTVD